MCVHVSSSEWTAADEEMKIKLSGCNSQCTKQVKPHPLSILPLATALPRSLLSCPVDIDVRSCVTMATVHRKTPAGERSRFAALVAD